MIERHFAVSTNYNQGARGPVTTKDVLLNKTENQLIKSYNT